MSYFSIKSKHYPDIYLATGQYNSEKIIINTAPTIDWAIGKELSYVEAYCRLKGFEIELDYQLELPFDVDK